MSKYLVNILDKDVTPQSEPIPGSSQVVNSAGGYTWAADDFTRLQRFLILGSEGGSYYISERKLTQDNAASVIRAIKADGQRAVREIVDVSVRGRAPKNDPALFALALAMTHGDLDTKRAAYAAVPQVARIGTHLFHLADYVDKMRGWGRGLKNAMADWYVGKSTGSLALQAVKYRQRDGWCHNDLLRLAHVRSRIQGEDTVRRTILDYMTKGWDSVGATPHEVDALRIIWATERAKADISEKELLRLIADHKLPMECIPTEKRSKAVYEAMLPNSGLTWLIRNLANLSRTEVIKTGQYTNLDIVVKRLLDEEQIKDQRVHPIQFLGALVAYKQGQSTQTDNRGRVVKTTTWPVVQKLIDTLDEGFHVSFKHVEPTNKRHLLGLDVSGSMSGGNIAGMPGLTPAVGAAAMSMVAMRTEPKTVAMAFNHGFVDLGVSAKDTLLQVTKKTAINNMGGTDCSVPMTWALKNKVEADVFVVYTDNETWAGSIHPSQALRQYRDKMGIGAKLIVVGMTSGGFTIADPSDSGMLDIVGFDSSAPQVMSEFTVSV